MQALIQFVGDPFVDSGVAVLEHRIDKPCNEFDRLDLTKQANALEELYSKKAWIGYLFVHFPNSCWCNPTMGAEKKRQLRQSLLCGFDLPAIPGRFCAYCRRPAHNLADRSTIPLLTGEATMSAGAGGEPRLAVCSACQYAIQFYPLATLKVYGKPLFWWTPHRDWMYSLTRRFAERVSRIIEASPDQVPSLGWPSTQLLETAEEVCGEFEAAGKEVPLVDLIGCHVTNYGSEPDYEEIRIRRQVLEFFQTAQQYAAYRSIRNDAWEKQERQTKSGAKRGRASNKPPQAVKDPAIRTGHSGFSVG